MLYIKKKKKKVLPTTKDIEDAAFSFKSYTYPASGIQYASISVPLIFIYLIKASCFLQRRAQERNIGLLIFSEADAFLSWALSELRMIYILVYSKKVLYFPIISLLTVQKIFRVVKPLYTRQVELSIFVFYFQD